MPVRIAGRDGQEPRRAERRKRPPTADRRPPGSEQVERRGGRRARDQILLTIERRARTVWTMRTSRRSRPTTHGRSGHHPPPYARPLGRATNAINRKLFAYLVGDWCPGHASRFASLAAGRTPPTAEQAQSTSAAGSELPARGTRRPHCYTRAPEQPHLASLRTHRPRTPAFIQSGRERGVRVGRPPFVRSERLDEDAGALAYGRMWAREWSSRPRVSFDVRRTGDARAARHARQRG